MTRTADVVVIGGGVTGVALAFHLTGLGVRRVLVLERRFLAAGGMGRSVGIIRQLYPTPEASTMVLRSLRVFQRFREAVGGEAGYVGCGALIGVSPAMRPKLEATLEVQRALGVRAELLEPEDVARVEPRIDPAGLGAVLYEPESGYGDPTGLWSPGVPRLAGVELPIVIGRHPVFIVERDPSFGAPHLVYLDLAGGTYVRPETGNLTLAGSLTDDEAEHPMDPELLGTDASFEEASTILERTGRALPRLADARYRRGYAGAFDITPDWMPILDESPVRGFYIAAGMSGHGFKLAPAVGELMAARITRTSPPVSPAPFALGRFTGTPVAGTFVASYLR